MSQLDREGVCSWVCWVLQALSTSGTSRQSFLPNPCLQDCRVQGG